MRHQVCRDSTASHEAHGNSSRGLRVRADMLQAFLSSMPGFTSFGVGTQGLGNTQAKFYLSMLLWASKAEASRAAGPCGGTSSLGSSSVPAARGSTPMPTSCINHMFQHSPRRQWQQSIMTAVWHTVVSPGRMCSSCYVSACEVWVAISNRSKVAEQYCQRVAMRANIAKHVFVYPCWPGLLNLTDSKQVCSNTGGNLAPSCSII